MRRTARGFTLVEAIATLSVLAVVLTLTSRIIFTSMDQYADAVAASRLVGDMSAAMEIASNTLRDIPPSAAAPAEPDLTAITATSIAFAAGDTLSFSNGALTLTTGGHAAPILTGVTSLALRALDASGASLALPRSDEAARQARQIEITLTAERAGLSRTLRTRVFLRSGAAATAD